MDADYVCTLTPFSEEVALRELKEDPKERLSQVETFRQWILSQKHISCPTDIRYLLVFLRSAKFSQLRAREKLENHLKAKTKNPQWIDNIDMAHPEIIEILKTGFITILPKADDKGRYLMFSDVGKFDLKKKWNTTRLIQMMFGMSLYMQLNENAQVNGLVSLDDMTHLNMKALKFWSTDDMTKSTKLWEGAFPGRIKQLHYYNVGGLFETMMAIFNPILPKKWRDRMIVHGKNMEDVYKYIPKELMPAEYLPDDYTGPSQGTREELADWIVAEMKKPEVRDRILYITDPKWKYDFKLKPEVDVPSASFRKLNVD